MQPHAKARIAQDANRTEDLGGKLTQLNYFMSVAVYSLFSVACMGTCGHGLKSWLGKHDIGVASVLQHQCSSRVAAVQQICNTCAVATGGPSPRFGYATPPPPPLPALRAHLVTKGQWLQAIHRVAPKILSPLLGPPRMQGLGSISAHLQAPKKARVR